MWPFLVLLLVVLAVGVFAGNDYGISYDETLNATQGEAALRTYLGSDAYSSTPNRADHGPVYFAVFSAVGHLVHSIAPSWTIADGRHLCNYLTFLAGVFFLYLLCSRLTRRRVAAVVAVLFATQPLMFGSAFINQKDIPFMTLFLGTIVLGIFAGDDLTRIMGLAAVAPHNIREPQGGGLRNRLLPQWRSASGARRVIAIACSVGLVAFVADAYVFGGLHGLARSLLGSAYFGTAPAPIEALFSRIATDAYKTSLPEYQAKLDLLFAYVDGAGSLTLLFITAVAWSSAFPPLARIWGFDWRVAISPSLLGSAVMLGATVCVRQLGLFAGGLVGLYILSRLRTKAAFGLLIFICLGGIVTYVTWPFLWDDPVGNFYASLQRAVNFPAHSVLFLGKGIKSSSLPGYYSPLMMSLELTIPAVILIWTGVPILVWRLYRPHVLDRAILGTIALWVGVPFAMLCFSIMSSYGIRQLLFLVPPLFVLAGLAIDVVAPRVRWPKMQIMLAFLALVPGMWFDVSLHPYQYVYFNSFAGGISTAQKQFGLDNWCISLRGGIEEINRIAPQDSVVLVAEHPSMVEPFARPDLTLTADFEENPKPDYMLSCAYRTSVTNRHGFTNAYEVVRGGAILTYVRQRIGSP